MQIWDGYDWILIVNITNDGNIWMECLENIIDFHDEICALMIIIFICYHHWVVFNYKSSFFKQWHLPHNEHIIVDTYATTHKIYKHQIKKSYNGSTRITLSDGVPDCLSNVHDDWWDGQFVIH